MMGLGSYWGQVVLCDKRRTGSLTGLGDPASALHFAPFAGTPQLGLLQMLPARWDRAQQKTILRRGILRAFSPSFRVRISFI